MTKGGTMSGREIYGRRHGISSAIRASVLSVHKQPLKHLKRHTVSTYGHWLDGAGSIIGGRTACMC